MTSIKNCVMFRMTSQLCGGAQLAKPDSGETSAKTTHCKIWSQEIVKDYF